MTTYQKQVLLFSWTDISKLSIAAHEVNIWHQMKVGWATSMIDSIMALKDAMRPLLLWRVQPQKSFDQGLVRKLC
jgi:hypothetical protein